MGRDLSRNYRTGSSFAQFFLRKIFLQDYPERSRFLSEGLEPIRTNSAGSGAELFPLVLRVAHLFLHLVLRGSNLPTKLLANLIRWHFEFGKGQPATMGQPTQR